MTPRERFIHQSQMLASGQLERLDEDQDKEYFQKLDSVKEPREAFICKSQFLAKNGYLPKRKKDSLKRFDSGDYRQDFINKSRSLWDDEDDYFSKGQTLKPGHMLLSGGRMVKC